MLIEEFVSKHLDLLAEEHAAEVAENRAGNATLPQSVLKRKGLCIPKLEVTGVKTGLYGRTVAKFGLKSADKSLPFNVFKTGDIVGIDHVQTEASGSGIVSHTSEKHISVAFEGSEMRDTLDSLAHNRNSVALIKLANEVTYKRLKRALEDLKKYSKGPSQHLIEVLFGDTKPQQFNLQELTFVNQNLNKCQRNAVKFALSQSELAIIHGPPGTGKTTTVVEVIAQLVKAGRKVLACAPSNVAVDNLVEKLSSISVDKASGGKMSIVRLGHPARMLEKEVKQLSLDALVSSSDAAAIVRDVRSDIEAVQKSLSRCPDKGKRYSLRQERKLLFSELKQRENKALNEILSSADVILATNVGAHAKGPLQHLSHDYFDDVIIDECGQSLEAACWISLLRARRCILAGDHLQLPPTIISHKAAANGLATTLLERMITLHGDSVVSMLTEQYRMHSDIMHWASGQMYDGKLTANCKVQSHLLSDMPCVENTEDTRQPLLLVDTAGCEMYESESEESISKANTGEAMIVCSHVETLVKTGVKESDIAIISPYNLQVDLLRQSLKEIHPNIEIKSVDGFQGREKEAVILTLVRSNMDREIGFLSDKRRLNVAVTRARRHLAVVCDSTTVCSDNFIKSLIDHITEHGDIRTGFEYMNDIENFQSFENLKPVKQTQAGNGKKKEQKTSKQEPPLLTLFEIKENYKKILLQLLEKQKTHTDLPETTFFDFSKETLQQIVTENSSLAKTKILVARKSQDSLEIAFPSILNSAERKAVHELCEEMSLGHESLGEDKDRHVVISFPIQNTSNLETVTPATNTLEETGRNIISNSSNTQKVLPISQPKIIAPTKKDIGKKITKVSPDSPKEVPHQSTLSDVPYSICSKCGKNLPEDNMTIHQIHCERIMRMKQETENLKFDQQQKIHPKSAKSKKKKPAKQTTKKHSPDIGDDFDTLLNEAISSNKVCCHGNCNTYVTTTGQHCPICKKTFCLKHHLPEVHGCGMQAHINARRQISRDGVLYNGGGVPDRTPDPTKRAQLKKRLDAKVKVLESDRKVGKSKKNK
ncbi:zinc finger protein 2 [Ciona intestinalis]